ncbi:MAG: transcription antitermination factor NusB [Candidatus Riflebacteria bacterium]|nr:transcription antitermination factor NusB [Candidatus Riflebacteria bacterium]
MSSRRRKAREVVLKVLYQQDVLSRPYNETLAEVLAEEHYRPLLERFGREFANLDMHNFKAAPEALEAFVGGFANTFIAKDIQNSKDPNELPDFLADYLNRILTTEDKAMLARILESLDQSKEIRDFALSIIEKTIENLSAIDEILQKVADNWALDRMAQIDKIILRFAACELLYFPDIPASVTINEAIEMSKKYSTERSPEFINGVLDKLNRQHKPQKNEIKKKNTRETKKS